MPALLQDERFLLLDALGRGGMASVYSAFDRRERRLVALKVAQARRRAGPDHPLSIEFNTWARLSHPNIVEAYELARARSGPLHADTSYLVLEHVDGLPANRAIAAGRESPQRVEGLAVQLLRGLSHVHESGWVHRDLKPANVLVTEQGHDPPHPRLTDFGLAVPVGSRGTPGKVSGSLAYVAPEVWLGQPVTAQADLYALGIMLYEWLTDAAPQPRNSPSDLARWHLSGPPLDPRTVRPRVPPRLARFIRRLTVRDPKGRPPSAAAALAELGHPPRASAALGVPGRAERAKLRLAVDAVRLGATRLHRLPEATTARIGLQRELVVLSHVHGLAYYRVPRGAPNALAWLTCELVSRQPAPRRRRWVQRVQQLGLHQELALVCLGDTLLPDPAGTARGPERDRRAMSNVVRLIHECAKQDTQVLDLSTNVPAPPWLVWLTQEMQGVLVQRRGPQSGHGGLLVVL